MLLFACLFGLSVFARAANGQGTYSKTGGLVYHDAQSFQLKCDIYRPKTAGPHPGIVAIHGGAWRSGSKVTMVRHAKLMAQSGYVVMAINYRHEPMYPFPAQIHDAKRAVAWLRSKADEFDVDSNRIGVYGYSAGGHLAALLGTTGPNDGFENFARKGLPAGPLNTQVSAVVIGGAPAEFSWIQNDSTLLAGWLGGTKANFKERYETASPIKYVSADDPPFYIYHGEYDLVVPISTSRKMYAKLTEANVPVKFDVATPGFHIGTFSDLGFMERGIVFFDEHLKKEKDENINARLGSPETLGPEKAHGRSANAYRWLGKIAVENVLKLATRIRYPD